MKQTPEEIFAVLFRDYPALKRCETAIRAAYDLLLKAARAGATVLICGNGGSAADSEHITGELMKGFKLRRPLTAEEKARFAAVPGGEAIAEKLQGAIRAVCLVSQTGLISAFANDVDASLVYAQQVYAYARQPEDVLIALTTSGNSANCVNAAVTAKACGVQVISITGEGGGKIAPLSDAAIALPVKETYAVQELTLPVYHALCAAAEAAVFEA